MTQFKLSGKEILNFSKSRGVIRISKISLPGKYIAGNVLPMKYILLLTSDEGLDKFFSLSLYLIKH